MRELTGIFWPQTGVFDITSHIHIYLVYIFLYAFEGGGKPYYLTFDELISQPPTLTPIVPGRGVVGDYTLIIIIVDVHGH